MVELEGCTGRKWRCRRDDRQASRSRKERLAALTSLLALARAERALDGAGFPITLALVPRHPDANVIQTARPRLLRPANAEKHPIASLDGHLLPPPRADSLMLQCEAYPVYLTSSLRRLNGKACRQGSFSTTGSWVFKVAFLSLLIWTRSLVISRLDTIGGHEAQQAIAPQVHRSNLRKVLRHPLLHLVKHMEPSSACLSCAGDSSHQLK
jgi:hypothetical protein